MRIGTWNLAGRWSAAHAAVVADLDADVLLLTEVPVQTQPPGYACHAARELMAPEVHWAAVLSRLPADPRPDPHPASAAVEADGVLFCSSVLPWPRAGVHWPWGSAGHADRMRETLTSLAGEMNDRVVVWGGDWNQPLTGNLAGFSRTGRDLVGSTARRLGLQVPTSELPGRPVGQAAIDHVAVPAEWQVDAVGTIRVADSLSDHDAYWVDVRRPLA